MANNERKVEEMLRTLYERNDQYQNIKERVVWLAGVVYLAFSAALMAWYLDPENRNVLCSIPGLEKWHGVVFLSTIFVLVAVFIYRQTRHRVKAAAKTEQFDELIGNLHSRRTYADLMNANTYNSNETRKPVCDFVGMGWSGHLIFGVVYSFFLAQLMTLYGFPKCWVWWILLVLPIVSVLILPPLVSWRCKPKKKKCSSDRYEGEFRDGLPNGQGTFYSKTGDVYTGKWVDGKPIGG